MYFVSLDEMVGGSILSSLTVTLPGYASPQQVIIPAVGATVYVYQRDTTTQVNVYEDEHGGGSPATQPLTTSSDGHIVDGSGNRVYVSQPQELDINVSGAGLTPRTIKAGDVQDATLTNVVNGLTSEISRATGAEGVLAANLATANAAITAEVARAEAAEAAPDVSGHIRTGGTAPGITGGPSGGGAPFASIQGTDVAGIIQFVPDAGADSADDLLIVTFAAAFTISTPRVVISPASLQAALGDFMLSNVTQTSFSIRAASVPAGGLAGQLLMFNYMVVGTH